MESLANANDTNELGLWLQQKSAGSGQSASQNGGVQPVGCPVPGHIEQLLADMPPAGATAEQQNSNTQPTRWQPQRLNSRHREIMRRVLEGANLTVIAEQMNMTYPAICLIVTSDMFRAELQKLEEVRDDSVLKRAEVMSNEALDVLKNQMRFARSEAIRNRAANDILDRGGFSKVEKKIIGVVNAEAVIREMNKQRKEALKAETTTEAEIIPHV